MQNASTRLKGERSVNSFTVSSEGGGGQKVLDLQLFSFCRTPSL